MVPDDPQPLPPNKRLRRGAEFVRFIQAVQVWVRSMADSLRKIPPATPHVVAPDDSADERTLDRAAIRVVELCNGVGAALTSGGDPSLRDDLRALQESVDDLTSRSRDLLALHRRAAQLQRLSTAVLRIYAAGSFGGILQETASAAREIVGAEEATVTLVESECCTQPLTVISSTDAAAQLHDTSIPFPLDPHRSLDALLCQSNAPLRLSQAELEMHPVWQHDTSAASEQRVASCYLGAPLVGQEGQNLGLVRLSGKQTAQFYAEDEALLMQLASAAAAAIENVALQQQLRNADRRKNEMLTMLAHELRNPLAPIRNGLDLLAMSDTAAAPSVLDGMRHQVEYLTRFADDLLDVARIVRGRIELRRELVELSEVVERAVETVRPLIDKQQHQLRVELPPEPSRLSIDPVRIAQAIGNLLTNAAKYTPPGGQISLTADIEDNQSARILIRDTGVGISHDLLPHVFELFRQADDLSNRAQGGLGIGLALVKRFVQLHGGSVSVHSEGRGRGAEFMIRLPLAQEAISDAPETKAAGTAPQIPSGGASYRILVVDDSRSATAMLSRLLSKLGRHVVSVAHDGREALEIARSERPDVILLDVGLPELSGHDVGRELRKVPELRDALLVAITGYGDGEAVHESSRAGFDLHLVKPCGIDDLATILCHPRLGRS